MSPSNTGAHGVAIVPFKTARPYSSLPEYKPEEKYSKSTVLPPPLKSSMLVKDPEIVLNRNSRVIAQADGQHPFECLGLASSNRLEGRLANSLPGLFSQLPRAELKRKTVTTKSKVALITGITGQDGSYLAEFLLEKGYIVHGIKRRASSFNTQRVDHIYQDPHVSNSRFKLHYGDLNDTSNLIRIIQETQPDEIYNLGAMSHVAVSFESPEYTADVDAVGT